jgi:outer membrane receptor protein involved in Fe transport
MNRKNLLKCITCVALPLALIPRLSAQTTNAPGNPSPAASEAKPVSPDEVVELSPFVVTGEEDDGYAAKYSLAGTRLRTDIKDVGSSVSIVTAKFLADTGTTNATQLLVYTPNTEVVAPGGNFLGIGDDSKPGSVNYGTTRVRGLTSADNTRDFYLTDIPWDSYNTGRIDIQRGPNSILFGIGSPAGIINASINHAGFKDSYKVSNTVDNFGRLRFTGDFNQTLIKNQLAIRLSLLDEHTEFQQQPAFRKDKRIFAALRYDPSFLNTSSMKTSFEANFEKGDIKQNLPRSSPPNDYLTPWFLLPDGRQTSGFRFAEGVSNDSKPDGFYLQGAGGIVNSGGTIATYYQGQATGLSYPHNQSSAGNAYIRGIADVGTVTNYKSKGVVLGAAINAWKSTTLSDRSIFDYQNILLDGDTKAEDNDFNTYNLAFRQDFLDGTLGYELAYDYQKANPSGHSFLSGGGYGIVVDVMGTLAGDANGGIDDLVNPNLGKPFVIGGTNSAWNWQHLTKSTARFTGYYDLDFKKLYGKDSKLAWIFGDNRFTALASRYKNKTFSSFSGGDYQLNDPARTELGNTVYIFDYLSQTKLTGHNPANINLQGISGYPILASGTVAQRDSTAVPYSMIPYTAYTEWQLPDQSRTYGGSPTFNQKTVDTAALVWQGYWLDGTIIPMVAVRRDEAYQQQGGYYNPDGTFHEGAPSSTRLDTNNQAITTYNPFADNYVLGPDSVKTRVNSRTYSLVTHLPSKLRAKLPGNADFQLIYNQSENFQPAPGRTDILNRPLPDPSGKTKEYGIAFSALNDKLYLKVVHYKTEQNDVAISQFAAADGSTVGGIGGAEIWARSAAKIHSGQAYGAVGPSIANIGNGFVANVIYGVSSSGHPVTFKPYGPWATSLGPDVIGTSPTVWDGRAASKPYNNGAEPYAAGTVRTSYTQAEIDATWAIEDAAIKAVLNNPPSDNFLTAMGIDKAQFLSNDANYFPSQTRTPSGEITGTTESEGTELELVAQPLKGLSVYLNVTKTSAKRTSLASSFVDYVAERRVFYENGPAGDMRIWSSGWADTQVDPYNDAGNANASVMFENHINSPVARFLAATNTNVPELHPWAANLVLNYTIPDSIVKGLSVGGGYRWQDRLVTGYPVILDANNFETYDLDHPYKGKAETAIDLWVGYERKIKVGNKRLNWHIQLNVRNVAADDKPIVASTQPDGSPAAYRIPEPRTFSLTNTFEF